MAVHVATYKEGDSEPHYWDDPSATSHKVCAVLKGREHDSSSNWSRFHWTTIAARVPEYFNYFRTWCRREGKSVSTSIRLDILRTYDPDSILEKASIDEGTWRFPQSLISTLINLLTVFIDYTIPVRNLLLERYPQLALPSGPFDLDTPLPPPPDRIDWAAIKTNVIPVTPELPKEDTSIPKPNSSVPDQDTPSSPPGIEGALASGSSSPRSIIEPLPECDAEAEAGVEAKTEAEAEIEPGSDAPPTWHDVALSIGAELMRITRVETFQKLGYTLSAVSLSFKCVP